MDINFFLVLVLSISFSLNARGKEQEQLPSAALIVNKLGGAGLRSAQNTNDSTFFEYKFTSEDTSWIPLGPDNVLRLDTLSSGTYMLQLRSNIYDEGATGAVIRMPIRIEKAFYKKYWFIILNSSLLLILAFGFYTFRQYRFNEKRKQQRLIDRLESKALRAQMNPHFIFNTLNGLQSTMILKGEQQANKYLGAFSTLLRSTLDMSKSDMILLADEVRYLTAYLNIEKLRQARDLETVIILVPEDLHLESVYIPCMIFQPLLENAILHGLAPKRTGISRLELKLIEDNGSITGIVTDNGIGRVAATLLKSQNRKSHRSWATSIMQDRIEIFNRYSKDKIDFKIDDLYANEVPCGTRVTVRFPVMSEFEINEHII